MRKSKSINGKLSKLSIHQKIRELNLDNIMMDFNATALYPSAMYDEKPVYPKIENGFVFKPHMNIVYIEAFNIQSFNKDSIESSILKTMNYNPPKSIVQHLPVKEKVKTKKLIE